MSNMTTKTIFRMYITIMLVMKVTIKVSIFSVKLNVYFVSFAEGQGYCPFHSENIREPCIQWRIYMVDAFNTVFF